MILITCRVACICSNNIGGGTLCSNLYFVLSSTDLGSYGNNLPLKYPAVIWNTSSVNLSTATSMKSFSEDKLGYNQA